MKTSGRCLCGKTRYIIDGEPVWAGSCYCTDCQKESGGGHLTAMAVPAESVQVSGPSKVYTSTGGSGARLDRTFCAECGSTLFSHPQIMGDIKIVRAGTLDDSSQLKLGMAVFCTQAQPWDQPPEGMLTFAEMPPQE